MILKTALVTTLAAIMFSACSNIKAEVNPPGESYTKARTSSYKFDYGPGNVEPGYIQITPASVYSEETGYGFHNDSLLAFVEAIDRGGDDALLSDFCTSTSPFFFTVDVPEGNYKVTVTMGDEKAETTTTVKAELRRLMLEKVHTASGEFTTRTFLVNTRSSRIAGDGEVKLKDREKTYEFWAWDDKLTFEFNDVHPTVCALEIARVDKTKTIFLLGDSTVCDQPREPYSSWGQMLTRFFKPEMVIANHSESGETFRDSQNRGRLDKILSLMKPGDYLIMQFGHNDMKERGEGIGPFISFKSSIKHFVAETRKAGGIPVLVTPMQRRNFDEQGKVVNSHGDYPEAVRQAAKEDNVPLIDLHAMSTTLYETLGPQGSVVLFSVPEDRTHHNNYGSYQLAKCIVQGIIDNQLDIAQYIVDDWQTYDPAHHDPLASWEFPASPQMTSLMPEGN
jgi:lysophospholipase L1-like esterase